MEKYSSGCYIAITAKKYLTQDVDQQTSTGTDQTLPSDRKQSARFLENVATVFGGQLACAGVALGIEICFARFTGPLGRGQISLCLIVIVIGSLLGGLGGEIPILIWAAKRKEHLGEWLPAVLFWGCLGCVCVDVCWWCIYRWWNPAFLRGITPSLALLVLVGIPANVAFQYVAALLAGLEKFRKRTAAAFVAQLVELAAVVVLVGMIRRTADMAIASNILGLVGATIVGALFVTRRRKESRKSGSFSGDMIPALSLGIRGQAGNVAMFFNYRLDVFVLNYFLGPAQVGLYALGVIVSESLWQVPAAAATVLLPRTARTNDEYASHFTCFVTRQVLLIAGLLGIVLALTCPLLIPHIFGAHFSASVAVIWWILPGTIALSGDKVMSADITARGKPEYNSIICLTAGVLTLALDFILIPRMGIRGAALASSIAYLTQTALTAVTLRRLLRLNWTAFAMPSPAEFDHYRNVWREYRAKTRRAEIIDVISTSE